MRVAESRLRRYRAWRRPTILAAMERRARDCKRTAAKRLSPVGITCRNTTDMSRIVRIFDTFEMWMKIRRGFQMKFQTRKGKESPVHFRFRTRRQYGAPPRWIVSRGVPARAGWARGWGGEKGEDCVRERQLCIQQRWRNGGTEVWYVREACMDGRDGMKY